MLQLRRAAAFITGIIACAYSRGAAWPEVKSDLPPDAAVHWGVLSNGLRYAVRHNDEPQGRVSIRLLVAAGSIDERESELGIAHFIEHMAYRGTHKHPNGGLTAELQRLGVGFGPDSAAFTFWDHTIYQLELPDASDATLREGLGVFREYASDISFEPALIQRERDVVLNELDTRDTPEARAQKANLRLLWPTSTQVHQWPIGLADNILHFTREQLLDFYNAWYRPNRMAVVVVGDIDPDSAARLVAEEMQGLAPRGAARADVIRDVPDGAGPPTIRVFVDGGLAGANCQFEHPFPESVSPDTHGRRVQQLRRALAFTMLQRRATRLAKAADGKFVVASAGVANVLPGWAYAYFGASGNIGDWKAFMTNLDLEYRQAYEFGFTGKELDVARTVFQTAYADAVHTSASWHSDWLATTLANSMLQGTVFSTPEILQQDLAADLSATTAAQCLAEFRRAWSPHSLHVFVSTNPAFRVTSEQIAAALNDSRQAPATRPVEKTNAAFAYNDFGLPGHIVSSRVLKDLNIWQAQFANGVRLSFKPTTFEVGSIDIAVRVGSGRLSQPKTLPGLDLLANCLLAYGGLGRHSVEELQDALAGHALSFNFNVDSDALEFDARCAPQDLGLCMRLIAAYLTDAGYRPDSLPMVRASMNSMYSSLASSPSGPISMNAMRVLSGGDLRFGTASAAEFNRLTVDQVRSWTDPQLRSGPIEIAVVGDTTWDKAAAEAAATFGALPQRLERTPGSGFEDIHPPDKPGKPLYLYTTDPSLRQVALSRFCTVHDLRDIHMERRCRLLAALLAERLRVRLRIELGASYGFDADFYALDGFPDFSFFACSTTVSPAHAEKANELIADEINSLRRGRFTEDEFERVRQPFLSKRDEDIRENGFWCYTVLRDCQQRPERLAAARDRQADYAAITRADVEALAAAYFGSKHWFQFTAYPRIASTYSASPALQPFR